MKQITATIAFCLLTYYGQAQNWTTSLNTGAGLKLGLSTNDPLQFYTINSVKMKLEENGLRMMAGLTLNNSLKMNDNFLIKYEAATTGVPNRISFSSISTGQTSPAFNYKAPCNIFNASNPNDPYPTMSVFQTAFNFTDLIQVYDLTSNAFLNMGVYNGDGIISVEPLPGAANTNNKLRLNAGCVNDVNICEGGGYTKMFNSAGVTGDLDVSSHVKVGGGSFALQSLLEMNLSGTAKAMLVSNPASSATDKRIFEVGQTGKTSVGVNVQSNSAMFTVGQASKTDLAFCLTDNATTVNKHFFTTYGTGRTYIGPDLAQNTTAMLTVGQANKSLMALSLADNTAGANKDFFNVYGDGYTEIKVYSPLGMPVPNYAGVTGRRVMTIRDMSNSRDLFVVRSDGKIYAREVEINLSTNFPDYVFSKNYDLKSISEVAAYIDNNSHLPGFEKGEFYEKNGINVNDMMIRQQEKIEEQMLYIIQLEKRLQIVDQLEKRLEALENKK